MGLFDVITGYGIYHQIRATQFVSTRGEIISSSVETSTDSDGTTYKPKVTFEYQVNNQTLLGKSIRYNEVSSSNGSYARDFVANHPVGNKIDVHYDPSNPSDAVLVTGIDGSDLFMLMFLMPFNVVMLGGWYFVARTVKQMIAPDSLCRPCRYSDDGYEMRIMIDRVSLIAVVGISLLALCFVSIFIIGFTCGFHASMATMLTVWSIILTITTLVTGWFAIRNWSGRHEILVRHFDRTITLPVTKKRAQEVVIPFKDIEQVYIDRDVETDSEGDKVESFFVRLGVQPDSKAYDYKVTGDETLAKFHDEEKAYRFVDWFAADVLKRKAMQVS